jgi:hypothetical protein
MPFKFPFERFFSNQYFTVPVMIGAVALTAMKYPIGEKMEVLASFGESYTSWEFAFQVQDLVDNSLAVPLPDGIKIVAEGRTFQATPFHGQPHYRWVDPDQTVLAVRCKEVGA